MGNDGGSIPTRRELVKTGSRAPTASELKATAHESLAHAWAHCALTDAPIVPSAGVPLAADYLGRIFSYEAVLMALSTPPDDLLHHDQSAGPRRNNGTNGGTNHNVNETPTQATMLSFGIRTLRDVVRIYPAAPPPEAHEDVWICSLSRKVLGAGTRAVYIVPCGHVFAEIALKEAGGDSCPECGAAIGSGKTTEDDDKTTTTTTNGGADAEGLASEDGLVLVLATGKEELDRAKRRMDRLRERGLTHSLTRDKGGGGEKKKKRRKRKERDGDGEEREGVRAKRTSKE